MSARPLLAAASLAALVSLVACGDKDSGDLPAPIDDTGVRNNNEDLVAEVVASDGQAFTFTASTIRGGWNEEDWGFAALGDDPTNALAFTVGGAPGVGTFPLTTSEDDDFATYTDFGRFGLVNGGFTSIEGSLTITDWEALTEDNYRAAGSFEVYMTNTQDAPITLEMSGEFYEAELFGEAR